MGMILKKNIGLVSFRIRYITIVCGLLLCQQQLCAQYISLNGAYVSVASGTVMGADTIANDNTTTLANAGTLNSYKIINAGTTQGNGTYNIAGLFTNTGTFSCGTS